MRPPNWNPPIKLSEAETAIISRIKRAKLFIKWGVSNWTVNHF